MDVPNRSVVADLGCGCGVLGIIAAKLGAKLVYSIDVNPHAVEDTRRNASINGVSNIIVPIQCDVREAGEQLSGKVDVIVCNPPQTPRKYQHRKSKWLKVAQNGGVSGRTLLDSVIVQAPSFFREERRPRKLEIATSSLLGIRSTLDLLSKSGFSSSIIASTLMPFRAVSRGLSRKKSNCQELTYERAVVIHATHPKNKRSSHNN
jgi:HemK-related putative methylase